MKNEFRRGDCVALGGRKGVVDATSDDEYVIVIFRDEVKGRSRECAAGKDLVRRECEAEDLPPSSSVDHPAHYGGADNPYEVIKVMEAWLTREEFIGALKFNIHKYTARAGRHAAGDENHEKALWYQNYLVDYLKRNPA